MSGLRCLTSRSTRLGVTQERACKGLVKFGKHTVTGVKFPGLSRSTFWGGFLEGRRLCSSCQKTRSRSLCATTRAMINVDAASPSLVLGCVLIGCSVILLQLRQMDNKMSRDGDIVVAAMVSIVGGTLIFQGWRLDPLLLLCQALTTAIAFWYGLEAFKSRNEADEERSRRQADQQAMSRGEDFLRAQRTAGPAQPEPQPLPTRQPGYALPPSDQGRYAPPWAQPQDSGAWQGGSAAGPVGQQPYPWAQQQQTQQQSVPAGVWASRFGDEERTIKYDYNGNPIDETRFMDPSQQQQPASISYPPAPYDDGQRYGSQPPQDNPYLQYWEGAPPGQYGLAVQREQYNNNGGPGGEPRPPQPPLPARTAAAGAPSRPAAPSQPPSSGRQAPRTFEKVDDWE